MSRRGWCPGALRPMPAGDGLLLRIRPPTGALTAPQLALVAELSATCGNGQIDLGSRATLQLRGIKPRTLSKLHAALAAADLLDSDPRSEARRNILLNPLRAPGDGSDALLAKLQATLRQGPDLPPKFGFAVDCAAVPALQLASADLRIERSTSGLILRADGMAKGEVVEAQTAVPRARAIADWFAAQPGARRMRQLVAEGRLPPLHEDAAPLPQPALLDLLRHAPLLFAPFGAVTAAMLGALATPLRLTPWRAVLPLLAVQDAGEAWLTDPAHPLLRLHACTGAPGCASAHAETRALARSLADLLPPQAELHVSGCAKGCACPRPAHLTLTAQASGFALIENGRAHDPWRQFAALATDIPALLRGLNASPL